MQRARRTFWPMRYSSACFWLRGSTSPAPASNCSSASSGPVPAAARSGVGVGKCLVSRLGEQASEDGQPAAGRHCHAL